VTSEAYDYSQDLPPLGDNILARITGLVQQEREAKAEIERLETELKFARDRYRELTEHELPALMEEAGQKDCTTIDGRQVTVCEVLRASIPEQHRETAHRWLREHNLESIIKVEVTASFGRGEAERAKAMAERVSNSGIPVKMKEAVHPSTLAATLRELIEKGVDFPLDIFGAILMKAVKVTEKKSA
jgi:hypothetical protein